METVLEKEELQKALKLPMGLENVYFISSNPADRHLLQLAVEEFKLDLNYVFFKDAEDFLQSLRGDIEPVNHRNLIFIDYFLIGKSGIDLLKSIRTNERFADTPALMMVPALFDNILDSSYQEGANCCILMPVDFYELVAILKSALSYWDYMLG